MCLALSGAWGLSRPTVLMASRVVGSRAPRYWWSGHHLITAQMQGSLTVSGTTSSPRADTTKSLSRPEAAWARCGYQPRRARCPLNTEIQRASGSVNTLRCWEGGTLKGTGVRQHLLPYLALRFTSIWLCLSCILYNTPVNSRIVLSSMNHSRKCLNLKRGS